MWQLFGNWMNFHLGIVLVFLPYPVTIEEEEQVTTYLEFQESEKEIFTVILEQTSLSENHAACIKVLTHVPAYPVV